MKFKGLHLGICYMHLRSLNRELCRATPTMTRAFLWSHPSSQPSKFSRILRRARGLPKSSVWLKIPVWDENSYKQTNFSICQHTHWKLHPWGCLQWWLDNLTKVLEKELLMLCGILITSSALKNWLFWYMHARVDHAASWRRKLQDLHPK